jgi:hypothetical protein
MTELKYYDQRMTYLFFVTLNHMETEKGRPLLECLNQPVQDAIDKIMQWLK